MKLDLLNIDNKKMASQHPPVEKAAESGGRAPVNPLAKQINQVRK